MLWFEWSVWFLVLVGVSQSNWMNQINLINPTHDPLIFRSKTKEHAPWYPLDLKSDTHWGEPFSLEMS
jgi:hypothetical protein